MLPELVRLDGHFSSVLASLRTHPPRGLTPSQTRARATHIERLDAYRRRRIFPKNRRFLARRLPHFIDDAGTRCAMGHLIEASGERDLVQWVARERNYARIRELRDISELVAWLSANGLTLDEAARIQPDYCGSAAQLCICGELYGGVLQGTLGDGSASLNVDVVYGNAVGVKVGDSVPLYGAEGLSADDIIFARWGIGCGTAGCAFVQFTAPPNPDGAESVIVIPLSSCSMQSLIKTMPGPLPMHVVTEALSSTNCEQVIAQYDPQWGAERGGSECTDGQAGTGGVMSGGGGGSPGSGGAGGSSGSGGTGATPADASSDVSVAHAGVHAQGGCDLAREPGSPCAAILVLSAACVAHRLRRYSGLMKAR